MTYAEKLEDVRWRERRKQIIQRDNNRCRNCSSEHDLEVHHRWYIPGAEPWDHPDQCLLTLCECCHKSCHASPDKEIDFCLHDLRGGQPEHIASILHAMGF